MSERSRMLIAHDADFKGRNPKPEELPAAPGSEDIAQIVNDYNNTMKTAEGYLKQLFAMGVEGKIHRVEYTDGDSWSNFPKPGGKGDRPDIGMHFYVNPLVKYIRKVF